MTNTESMAYGQKYLLRYESEIHHRDVQLKIYPKDFVGSVVPKKIGAGRIRLNKDEDNHVCGTSLEFSIQSDVNFEYQNFFTNDNKAHKVELVWDTHTIWSGYIVSDQYSEPYVAPPYDVDVLCTDGLGLLKTEPYELTGRISRFTAIRYILDKIGLGLGYLINVDLWETTMDPDLHNMLDQLYFDSGIFSGKNCYEVLQSLLPEDVTITQEWNRWLIQRSADFVKTVYAFNNAGVYEDDSTTQPAITLGMVGDSEIHPDGNLTMSFLPALKNFTVDQVYGKKESFLKNYNFKSGVNFWTEHGGTGFLSAINLNDDSYGIILGNQSTPVKHIEQSFEYKSGTPLSINIKYAPVGYYQRDGFPGLSIFLVDVYFQVILDDTVSTDIYYLNGIYWEKNTSVASKRLIKVSGVETSLFYDSLIYKELNITASKIPEDGRIYIRIYQIVFATKANHNVSGLAVQTVKVFSNDLTIFPDTESTKVVLTADATESGKTIELKPVDLPVYDNAELYFDNGNFIKVGVNYIPANLWGDTGVRYLNYLAVFIDSQYKLPRSILKGTLIHNGVRPYGNTLINEGFGLNSRVIHALNGSKKFTITSGTWNVLDDTYDVTLLELVPVNELSSVTVPEPLNPRTRYDSHTEIADYISINPAITKDWMHNSEGSYTHNLPGSNVPTIIDRRETLTPYQLDVDAGTPQFSLKDTMIEPNYTGNANKVLVNAGALVNHNFNALKRAEINYLKDASIDYDPTREWTIESTEITLPNDNGHFIYIKVPID